MTIWFDYKFAHLIEYKKHEMFSAISLLHGGLPGCEQTNSIKSSKFFQLKQNRNCLMLENLY